MTFGYILFRSFLFPLCLSLAGLKDEPLGIGWDLLEPERSLVLETGPDANCESPVWPVNALLCKQIDNTTSTSGDGPKWNRLTMIITESNLHALMRQ